MRGIILQYTIFLTIVFGILAAAVYVVLIRRRFFHTEAEYRSMDLPPEQLEICLKLRKRLEIPMRILTCMTALFVLWAAIPVLKDIKYMISGEYPQITGKIMNEVIKGGRAWRDTLIISSNGTEVELSVDSLSYQKGDIVTVLYLPNIKAGVIVK